MANTPRLAMPYLVASQAQKEVTHNDALNDMDFLAQSSVIDRTLNAPPASPANGDMYIVGTSPTGAWTGHAGHLAAWYSGWKFKTPSAGWTVWAKNDSRLVYYTGSAWAVLETPAIDGTFTWNPGTIANGAGATSAAVTVTGAALGDFASVAAPYDLQGLVATAWISAANTALVRLQNGTGGGVTLGSGTWRVRARKA